ncbi:PA3371 family protein [Pseudomonas sp.]|uniref:PA3371 family protein n=1 Tax=Pseudomonas sp. TaxID=306 RepID=UPI0028A8A2A8|nr:PA3371 family protein [Pseudomonas sp.]
MKMSGYGWFFLFVGVACAAIGALAELTPAWDTVIGGCAVLFGSLFVISLILGRRIKFDPVLR